MPRIFTLVVLLCAAAAHAQSSERVISETYYVNNNVAGPPSLAFVDSAHYFYSGTRGSQYDYVNLCYGCGRKATLTDPDYNTLEPRPHNLDAPLRPLAMGDSLRRYFPGPDTPYHSSTLVIRYNADSSVADMMRYAFGPNRDTDWTEGATLGWTAGRLSRVYTRRYGQFTPGWDTLSIRFIEYDAAGLVTLDSLSGSTVVRYSYDAAGRYITRKETDLYGTPPYISSADSNVYDASGRLQLRFHRGYNQNLNIYQYYNDSFAYTAGVPGFSAHVRFYVDPATGAPDGRQAATIASRINAMNRTDSVTTYSGPAGAWAPVIAFRLFYNANGNPVRKERWSYSLGPSPWLTEITSYGYVPLGNPPTHADDLIAGPSITAAPNPSGGTISLRWSGLRNDARLRARLMTITGQLLFSEDFRMGPGDYVLDPGNGIAPGSYILQIIDEQGHYLLNELIGRR